MSEPAETIVCTSASSSRAGTSPKGDQMARQMVNFVYLIGDRATGEAVIVDPAYAVEDLLDMLEADGMKLSGVLATHYHPDHVGGEMAGWGVEGIGALLEKVQVPVHLQKQEVPWVERTTGVGAVAPGRSRQRRRRAGRVGRGGADPHARSHAGEPVLLGRRSTGGRRHPLSRGLWSHRSPRVRPVAMYDSINNRLARVPDDAVLFPGHCTRPTRRRAWGRHARRTTSSGPAPFRSGWPCSEGDDVRRACRPTGRSSWSGPRWPVCGPSRRCAPRDSTGKITLVGEELHLPYDRPPLSKQVLAGTWPPEKAVLADRRRAGELQVHEVLGHRAVRLDVEARQVEIDDGTVLTGDALVVATGAAPRPSAGHGGTGPA